MYKIVLITSKDCAGCRLMVESVKEALSNSSKSINYIERNLNSIERPILRKYGIKDVPTILFFKDDELVYKAVGSRHYLIVLRWIDIHFK